MKFSHQVEEKAEAQQCGWGITKEVGPKHQNMNPRASIKRKAETVENIVSNPNPGPSVPAPRLSCSHLPKVYRTLQSWCGQGTSLKSDK